MADDAFIAKFPINLLPSELLAEVFGWYILRVYESRCLADPPTPYAWLAIRHVCSKWRQTALRYPRLSTVICLTRSECVEDMLRQSGKLPVYVYSGVDFTTHPQDTIDAHRMALNNLHRVHSADIKITDPLFAALRSNQQEPFSAPTLTSLKMLMFGIDLVNSEDVISPYFPHTQFPRLSSLSYMYGNIKPCASILSQSLSRLHLCYISPRITAEELLEYLAPLCNLEELDLQEILAPGIDPTESNLTNQSLGMIVLPRIRYISFEQTYCAMGVWLISRIKSVDPISLHVTAGGLVPRHLFDAATQILSSRPFPNSHSDAAKVQSLSIEIDAELTVSLRVWSSVLSFDEMRQKTEAPRPLLEIRLKGETRPNLLMGFLSHLPLSELQVTCLSELPTWRLFSWPFTDVLSYLSSTEVLHVEYHMCAKSDNVSDRYVIPNASFVFPRVKRLELHEVWHASDRCFCKSRVNQLNELVELLRWRDSREPGRMQTVITAANC